MYRNPTLAELHQGLSVPLPGRAVKPRKDFNTGNSCVPHYQEMSVCASVRAYTDRSTHARTQVDRAMMIAAIMNAASTPPMASDARYSGSDTVRLIGSLSPIQGENQCRVKYSSISI